MLAVVEVEVLDVVEDVVLVTVEVEVLVLVENSINIKTDRINIFLILCECVY